MSIVRRGKGRRWRRGRGLNNGMAKLIYLAYSARQKGVNPKLSQNCNTFFCEEFDRILKIFCQNIGTKIFTFCGGSSLGTPSPGPQGRHLLKGLGWWGVLWGMGRQVERSAFLQLLLAG